MSTLSTNSQNLSPQRGSDALRGTLLGLVPLVLLVLIIAIALALAALVRRCSLPRAFSRSSKRQ